MVRGDLYGFSLLQFLMSYSCYAGVPREELRVSGQPPKILDKEEQEKMRAACRVCSFFLYRICCSHALAHVAFPYA
jgi:hypothetical protein